MGTDFPRITQTRSGHPGDPLNVGLIGTESELKAVLKGANWHLAQPLDLKNDLKIGIDSVFNRPYDNAPVSTLILFDRPEDLAFEQQVGRSPRHRHHVRLWRTRSLDEDGRPLWIGAATYDMSVGLSHLSGVVTHHISPDIDEERKYILDCVEQSIGLKETYKVNAFHEKLTGKNGGGDPWHTDGDLWVGVLVSNPAAK